MKPEDDSADISINCFKKALDQGLPDAMAALAEAWRYGDMVYYHDKDVDLQFRDMLALKGTRLGSRHLLNQTVIAHTEGRLDDYATKIERYYDPVFDDDGNDLPDDDGRFDAWA